MNGTPVAITREQWTALFDHPDVQESIEYSEWLQTYEGLKTFAQAFVKVQRHGKSRSEQLRRYKEKKRDPNATFRPYTPLKASEATRIEAKRRAAAEGVSSDKTQICGHQSLEGKRCWLAPHAPTVPHRF